MTPELKHHKLNEKKVSIAVRISCAICHILQIVYNALYFISYQSRSVTLEDTNYTIDY